MGEWTVPACRTVGGVHIPGCYGCAIYGHHRCTCDRHSTSPGELKRLRDRVQKLERIVASSLPLTPRDTP